MRSTKVRLLLNQTNKIDITLNSDHDIFSRKLFATYPESPACTQSCYQQISIFLLRLRAQIQKACMTLRRYYFICGLRHAGTLFEASHPASSVVARSFVDRLLLFSQNSFAHSYPQNLIVAIMQACMSRQNSAGTPDRRKEAD